MNEELIRYIAEAKTHGLDDLTIKRSLLDAGWTSMDIEEALTHTKTEMIKAEAKSAHDASTSNVLSAAMQTKAAVMKPAADSAQPAPGAASQAATPTLSDAQFAGTQNNSANPFKKTGTWMLISAIILLAAGGYAAYAKLYVNPTKVWSQFTAGPKITTVKGTYDIKYSDPNDFGGDKEISGFQLKNIFLEIKGDTAADVTDEAHPKFDGTFNYTFGAGNTNISSGFGLREIDQDIFFKVGDNPFLSSAVASIAKKKYDWVKINIDDLQSTLSKNSTQEDKDMEAKLKGLMASLGEIAKKHTVLKNDKYIGKETVNGVETLHYKNSIDKAELKAMADEMVDAVINFVKQDKTATVTDDEIKASKAFASGLIDKFQVKEFDTWIGKNDSQLYQLHFVSNMPSIINLAKLSSDPANQIVPIAPDTAADEMRLADAKQISSALELYAHDHSGNYPEGDNGKPIDLAPIYLGSYPTPPSPAGGKCPEYYNNYWYSPSGPKTVSKGKTVYSSYTLTFCLATDSVGYSGGLVTESPQGIQDKVPCLGTQEQCTAGVSAAGTGDPLKQVQDLLGKLDFSAKFKIDMTYGDYGKPQKIDQPSEFFDLNKFIEDNMGSGGSVQGTGVDDSKL